MSLRLKAYVAPTPPQGTLRHKVAAFCAKVDFFWKSLLQSFLCENFQWQSYKAFTGLSNLSQKWLVGMSPFIWKFGPNWPPSLKNDDFESIFARSVSAITASKKVQLW